MRDCLVIIPTYKEKENIEKIIKVVLDLNERFEILIIDDNSPDGTADIVKRLIQEVPGRIHILEREGKLGLGTAYILGFRWALKKNYEFIFEMDADFSHNPKDLLRLLEMCETKADLAVGSRYVKGGKVKNWPAKRVLLSYFASVYVRMIIWFPVKDTTAGFVCYRRRVLETINLDSIQFVGYAFQIEMKYATWRTGFKIKEVPITFIDRVEGVSKMSSGIFSEAVIGVLKMKINSIFHRKYYRQPKQLNP